jgi:hypothetical protein
MTPLLKVPTLLTVAAAFLLAGAEAENPLLKELLDKGIELPELCTIRLPPPAMKKDLTPKQQQAVVEKAGGVDLELFVKDTVAAPFALKIQSVEKAGQRVAQAIHLAFIAHGDLNRVVKEDVLNRLLGTEARQGKKLGAVKFLTADMLKERGIVPSPGTNPEERFAALEIFLLDKVKVKGVTRNVKTEGDGWAALAMRLDPRFNDDKQFPNCWQSYNAIEDVFGPPQHYTGLAGYTQVTKLAEPKGALFFEMHVVLSEPKSWFGGPNLLRSKLPLVLQENVRNLRKRLAR